MKLLEIAGERSDCDKCKIGVESTEYYLQMKQKEIPRREFVRKVKANGIKCTSCIRHGITGKKAWALRKASEASQLSKIPFFFQEFVCFVAIENPSCCNQEMLSLTPDEKQFRCLICGKE